MTATVEPLLAAALLRAADRLDLPVTRSQVVALAVAVSPDLAPAESEVPSPAPARLIGPTPEQVDNLIAKARDRALTAAEAARLAAGVKALRTVADLRNAPYRRDPLEVLCPACKAVPGAACTSSGGGRYRAHRARLRACV